MRVAKRTSEADHHARPSLVVLGGFLGAGKTTLIMQAAHVLQKRGLRSAAILNDQGAELVDTRFLEREGMPADQVTRGCFCCRFSDLIDAAERLRAHAPHVIFAEAVGSCTDISATTLQPLKLHFGHEFRLAPYSVLVDPVRARELSGPTADPELSFLFHKQLEEADLVVFNKADVCSEFPEITAAPIRYLSALAGTGVDAWVQETLAGEIESGGKILEIDYERYARAEAKLAWLNCRATVEMDESIGPAQLAGPLLEALDSRLTKQGLRIAHLKILNSSEFGYIKASVLRNGAEPSVEGQLLASASRQHELLINARVACEPDTLRSLLDECLSSLPGSVNIHSIDCFSPAAPKPEYRIDAVAKVSACE